MELDEDRIAAIRLAVIVHDIAVTYTLLFMEAVWKLSGYVNDIILVFAESTGTNHGPE